MANNVVYMQPIARARGKALNADDGKEIWSQRIWAKDGWFSRSSRALLSGGVTVAGGRLYRQ